MTANPGEQFESVLRREKLLIAERRHILADRGDNSNDGKRTKAQATDHKANPLPDDLTGLALSGGGVRSAAFCLGVLQAFFDKRVLESFDYLSTVSGGGYIGAYFTSWLATLKNNELAQLSRTQRPNDSPAHAHNLTSHYPPAIDTSSEITRAQLGRLANLGSRMMRPLTYLSRHLPGWLLTALLISSGLTASTSLAALLFRSLDHRDTIAYLTPLGYGPDLFRAFLPAGLSLILLLTSILITSIARSLGYTITYVSSFLYGALLASLAAGFVSLMATGNVDIAILCDVLDLKPTTQDTLQKLVNTSTTVLLSLLTIAVLPALSPRKLLESSQAKTSPLKLRIFNIATVSLLLGIPLLFFGLLAQENISGENETRRNRRDIAHPNIRDWGSFTNQLILHSKKPNDSRDPLHKIAESITKAIGKQLLSHTEDSPQSLRHHVATTTADYPAPILKRKDTITLGTQILTEFQQMHEARRQALTSRRIAANHAFHIAYICGLGQRFADTLANEQKYRQYQLLITTAINSHVLNNPDALNLSETPPATFPPRQYQQKYEAAWKNSVHFLHNSKGTRNGEEIGKLRQKHDLQRIPELLTSIPPTERVFINDLLLKETAEEETARNRTELIKRATWQLIMLAFSKEPTEFIHTTQTFSQTDLFFDTDEVFAWNVQQADQDRRFKIFMYSLTLFSIGGLVVTMNPLLLQNMYRDTLSSIWLSAHGLPAVNLLLKDLRTVDQGGPYHIMNCSVSLFEVDVTSGKSQNGNFIFTQEYVGAKMLGYVETSDYCRGNITVAEAMALSGAAVSPIAAGNMLARVAMLAMNMRLGRWLPHPTRPPGDLAFPSLFRLAWQWITQSARERSFLFVTDGGHNENLGISCLLQRRCKFIVACDAGLDPAFTFDDLLKLQSEGEGKFGIRWTRLHAANERTTSGEEVTTKAMGEQNSLRSLRMFGGDGEKTSQQPYTKCAESCVELFKVDYPSLPNQKPESAILVYIKLSVPDSAPWDLKEFMRADAVFPHDSTADQFFDETRFLRYVSLGKHCGEQAVDRVRAHIAQETQQKLRQSKNQEIKQEKLNEFSRTFAGRIWQKNEA